MLGKMTDEQLRARIVFLMAGMRSHDLLDVAMYAEKVGLYASVEAHGAPNERFSGELFPPCSTSRVRRTGTTDKDCLDFGFDGRAVRTSGAKT